MHVQHLDTERFEVEWHAQPKVSLAFRYTSAVQWWYVKRETPTPGAHRDASPPLPLLKERGCHADCTALNFPGSPVLEEVSRHQQECRCGNRVGCFVLVTVTLDNAELKLIFSCFQGTPWTWTWSSQLDVFLLPSLWSVACSRSGPKHRWSDTKLCPQLKVTTLRVLHWMRWNYFDQPAVWVWVFMYRLMCELTDENQLFSISYY